MALAHHEQCLYDEVIKFKMKRKQPGHSLGFEIKSHDWKAPNGTQGVEGHSIFRILPGSPASKSGCKAGDVLISVDGVNVKHRVHVQLVQALMLAGNDLSPFSVVVGRPTKKQLADRAAPAASTVSTQPKASSFTTPGKKKPTSVWSSVFKTPRSSGKKNSIKKSASLTASSSKSSSSSSSSSSMKGTKGKSKSSGSLSTPFKPTPAKGNVTPRRIFRPLFIGTPAPTTPGDGTAENGGYPTPASIKAAEQQRLLKQARAAVLK
eukprot:gene122-18664_t